jgi:hypothetical protein
MALQAEESAISEIAQAVIEKFPAFKSFNIEIFNQKASVIKFNDVIRYVATSN